MKKNIVVVCLLATVLAGCGAERGEETKKKSEQNIERATLTSLQSQETTPTLSPETVQEQTSQGKYEDISTLPEEIQQILYNSGTFFEVEHQKEYTKETYKLPNNEGIGETSKWGSYLVYDLDEDGEKELAVEMDSNSTATFIEVFDKQEDRVYGYAFPYRGFTRVYTDRVVHGSSGADRGCLRTIKFNKNKYEETIIAESTAEENEDGDYMSVCYIGEKKVSEEEYYEFISRYHNEEVTVSWSTRPLDEVIKE